MKRRVYRIPLVVGLIAAAFAASEIAAQQTTSLRRPVVGRSVVSTQYGIVATTHPLASRAGVEMLERGGNAVDAAIAANAAMGLMEPGSNGIGGDLFVIYHEAATGRTYGLNSSGWAPTGLTVDLLKSKGEKEMPRSGIYTVTVPGAVAG